MLIPLLIKPLTKLLPKRQLCPKRSFSFQNLSRKVKNMSLSKISEKEVWNQ